MSGPIDYHCTRCDRTAADARENGCARGPCPMAHRATLEPGDILITRRPGSGPQPAGPPRMVWQAYLCDYEVGATGGVADNPMQAMRQLNATLYRERYEKERKTEDKAQKWIGGWTWLLLGLIVAALAVTVLVSAVRDARLSRLGAGIDPVVPAEARQDRP